MIQELVRDVVREEARSLPFVSEKTAIFEPRENDEMRMYLFCNPGETQAYRAYFGFVLNEREGVFEIRRVGVHEAYQGRGWGRALVECLERIAQACGYDRIRVEKNRNPSFWEHMGYAPAPRKHEKLLITS